jgi:hypothetical protein
MRQRTISDFFWRDPEISDLSQEDKATLLYFLTSPSSNIIGCYQVVWMIAAAEMGWTKDQLLVVAKRLKARGLLDFNETGWVWVKIWWKHNSPAVALNINSKLVAHAKKQCAVIPFEWLADFGKGLERVGVNTLAIGYPYPIDAPCHAASDAPSDAPYHAPSDGAYHGSGGNRYLVSCNNTTTTASSVSEADQAKPVVVDDLIFPPGITPDQHDAIRSMLSSSGVAHIHWQAILDELHGAQIHGQKIAAPISNPAGYVRGITRRAADGSFNPERGVAVANQREMRKNLERQDALRVASQPKFQTVEAQLEHLPENLRGSLSRILANKTREDAGA